MGEVVQLGEYCTRNQDTAASAVVDDIDIEEATPFDVSFSGTPDEIFDGVVAWLSTQLWLPEVVITRSGYIEFADVADDDTWRERYEDTLWKRSLCVILKTMSTAASSPGISAFHAIHGWDIAIDGEHWVRNQGGQCDQSRQGTGSSP